MNGWTLERRQRQAQLIGSWKPWNQSTGPKTAKGKSAVSKNAEKHGRRSAESIQQMRELRNILATFRGQVNGLLTGA